MDEEKSNLSSALMILGNHPWKTASEISKILRDEFRIGLHWRSIQGLLRKDRSLASSRKRNGTYEFNILKAGQELLDRENSEKDVTYVEPSKALSSAIKFHGLLASLTGDVKICDPYLSDETIHLLDACNAGVNIRFLTFNISESGSLRSLIAAAKTSNKPIEARRTKTDTLHDRYIIDKKNMFILGTSLNGFGKKKCFVIRMGEDFRKTMSEKFEEDWTKATQWT